MLIHPTERSEILLAHDDHYIYLAGRLYDSEQEKILSNSKQRDSGNPACEWFGIVIDSFNDKENALAFFMTPSGLHYAYGLDGLIRVFKDNYLFYDGRRFSLGISPAWSIISDLGLSLDYELNRMTFPDRGQELTTHIARIRALTMLSTSFSAMAFVQYNSAVNAVSTNIRLRYNPREGVDFYLVYNEALNTDRARMVPVLPLTDTRTLLLKFTYTFNFKKGGQVFA